MLFRSFFFFADITIRLSVNKFLCFEIAATDCSIGGLMCACVCVRTYWRIEEESLDGGSYSC